ncbi:MAG: hypothetical protein IT170_09990 [Bryobacterales bacterium]|nr:hypothetical protein [Bryobacterales bacterium]
MNSSDPINGFERATSWLSGAMGLRDGQSPFPWQMELLRRFCASDLPSAINIPTGLGKTAVMAIWLVAKATGANLPETTSTFRLSRLAAARVYPTFWLLDYPGSARDVLRRLRIDVPAIRCAIHEIGGDCAVA